jgi:hypothetical protein
MFKYQKPREKNHKKLGRKGKIENINGGDYSTNGSRQKHPFPPKDIYKDVFTTQGCLQGCFYH